MTPRWTFATLGLLVALPVCAQSSTDRDRHGLIGQVRSVRSEVVTLEKKSGTWTEAARKVVSEVLYERDGSARVAAGRGPEDPAPDPGSALLPFATREHPGSRIAKAYDGEGNLVEESLYAPDGSFRGNVIFTYDGQGDLVGEEYRRADGTVRAEASYEFDTRGRVAAVKRVEYKRDGATDRKSGDSYEYDAMGNWIKRTRWVWNPDAAGEKTAVRVVHRAIEYY
jgi:hypothetical protein